MGTRSPRCLLDGTCSATFVTNTLCQIIPLTRVPDQQIIATRGCWWALGEPKQTALVSPTTSHTLKKIAGPQVTTAVVDGFVQECYPITEPSADVGGCGPASAESAGIVGQLVLLIHAK